MIAVIRELPKPLRERAENTVSQLKAALAEYKNVCYANSLGPKSRVLSDLIWEHDSGFPSIGCAPCTRAVLVGEGPRSGRWWWERADSHECGLHPHRMIPSGATKA